jgi:hypothetical protein
MPAAAANAHRGRTLIVAIRVIFFFLRVGPHPHALRLVSLRSLAGPQAPNLSLCAWGPTPTRYSLARSRSLGPQALTLNLEP